ncbi:hypothetical protein [Streptomyces sp. NPDC048142]|uniref:hypothetical protein n=1 Tax=Streptomyces sp. NPDC048142 TaxID=3365501 RepID=UPI00371B3226
MTYIGGGPNLTLFAFNTSTTDVAGLIEVHADGSVLPTVRDTLPDMMLTLNGEAPLRRPSRATPEDIQAETPPPESAVVRTARAIAARHAAAAGNHQVVETFMTEVLGLCRGARWQEPVATALLGDWVGTLPIDGQVGPGGLERLKTETRELHRHLTPIWRRKVNGNRVHSLDVDLGGGLSVQDLIAGGPDPLEVLVGALPDDPRVAAVLKRLTPTERAVAAAWANFRTTTWAEAAAQAVAEASASRATANALGERVRRKLRRLGRQYAEGALARAGGVEGDA